MSLASQIELPERYRVARHIASGGMASVWEAEDLLLARVVAVKLLGAQFAGDPAARVRFQREARTAAQISGRPHIVTIYDIGEHRDNAFIVMEYFAGGTVADRLRAARDAGATLPQATALRWLHEAAAGLDVAHAAGIVHRDVKPANLMLDEADRLAVGDFGIARLADDTQMTQTGQVLGTAAYLSPEQALGRPATAASDRYALAVVAYELIAGERPFAAGPATAQARQHAETPPPRASQALPGLPHAVDDVLASGLAKEPSARPPSAAAFVIELERALRAQPAPAAAPELDVTRPLRVASPAARSPRPPRPPRDRPPTGAPAGRRRMLAAGLAAGAGLVAAIALIASGGNDSPSGDRGATTARQGAAHPAAQGAAASTTPAAKAPAAAPATGTGGGPVALDTRGYGLIKQGQYAAAVPYEQQAVAAYSAAGDTSSANYSYAIYNLGTALNRSGRPAEAIPYLQERLKISNDRPGVVRSELAAARSALGGGSVEQGRKPGKKHKGDGGR